MAGYELVTKKRDQWSDWLRFEPRWRRVGKDWLRWLIARKTTLFEGRAACIALELEAAARHQPSIAEALKKEAGYFRKNRRHMQYQEMREDGWAIGSGKVESEAKQFKARFAGPGMRWSRSGAEHLIPVRAAIMSGRFDELWRAVYNSPPN
jgi:hypothetical protein